MENRKGDMLKMAKMKKKKQGLINKIMFWINFSWFSLDCCLLGFMIGGSKELIAGSSKTIFQNYLLACYAVLVGSLYFVIKYFILCKKNG